MFPLLQHNEQILDLMKTLSNGEKKIRDSDRVPLTPSSKMLETHSPNSRDPRASSPLGHLKQMLSVKNEEGEGRVLKQEKVEVKQEVTETANSTKVDDVPADKVSNAGSKGFLSFSVSAILAKAEIGRIKDGLGERECKDEGVSSEGEEAKSQEKSKRKEEQKRFLEEHQHRIGSLLSSGQQGRGGRKAADMI